MLEKEEIKIPVYCTGSEWVKEIFAYMSQFDTKWVPPERLEERDWSFRTPLQRHRYFSAETREKLFEKWGQDFPWIERAFACLAGEYEDSYFIFDESNTEIYCWSRCQNEPIAKDFQQLFCCSVFLDFGIRQFVHRIGFALERYPEEFYAVPMQAFFELLKGQNFIKQWFSTALDQVWMKNQTCCLVSRELDDAFHISFFYNDKERKDCEKLVCFLREGNGEEDTFFGHFPQWG